MRAVEGEKFEIAKSNKEKFEPQKMPFVGRNFSNVKLKKMPAITAISQQSITHSLAIAPTDLLKRNKIQLRIILFSLVGKFISE